MTKPTCLADECERPAKTRGCCQKHYVKLLKYGNPNAGRVQYKTPEESFAARTKRDGDCLVWTAGGNGVYGVICIGNGEDQYAHRYAWERVHGPIPDGMMPDHICPDGPNKLCVNVAHLRLSTKKQNAENVTGPRADNTSGYLGVGWDKSRSKWIAYASIDGKLKNLGRFADVEEAAEVARLARLQHYTHNDHDRVTT